MSYCSGRGLMERAGKDLEDGLRAERCTQRRIIALLRRYLREEARSLAAESCRTHAHVLSQKPRTSGDIVIAGRVPTCSTQPVLLAAASCYFAVAAAPRRAAFSRSRCATGLFAIRIRGIAAGCHWVWIQSLHVIWGSPSSVPNSIDGTAARDVLGIAPLRCLLRSSRLIAS